MNIAILGATGLFGKALVKSLLADTDYRLTLIARHAKSEYQDNDRISVIDADATDIDALKKALTGTDLVYCTISGESLPIVAANLVKVMPEIKITAFTMRFLRKCMGMIT